MRVGFNPVWLVSPCTCAELLSPIWLFVTLWTMTCHDLCPWDSPGTNTGVGRHALLQGIFLTQGWEPTSLRFPALANGFFNIRASGKPQWFYKQKKFRDRQLDRENGVWRWRCITQERGLEQILPSGPQRKPTILTSWSQISSLWTMKQLHFCLFKATQDGEHMCTHGWFMSMYGKNHYNIVK